MKEGLWIVALVCICTLRLFGQPRQEPKELLKELMEINFEMLGELDSRRYCDVMSLNGELPRATVYTDSVPRSIKYWFSNDIDFREVRLIEFEIISIDTAENKSMLVKRITAWKNLNVSKVWNVSKNEIRVKLPSTTYHYIGIQKSTGEIKENVVESPLTGKPITVKMKSKELSKDEVVVTYFETGDNLYIGFYKT